MKIKHVIMYAVILCLTLVVSPQNAQAKYPDRPINIIIPFGPGGAVDIATRILAEYMETKHEITLNVITKGGGAGVPAMLDVARARPDGYTFGFPSITNFATTPQVKKTGYTLDDFKAVAQITIMWMSLAVNADSDIKNIHDLMAAAKEKPGSINFSTHGGLSTQRLFMFLILDKFPGISLPHITYTSGHEVSTALLGRHVTSGFGVVTNQKPYVESGDFTMLGVTSPERVTFFPDVPTFAEQLDDPELVLGSIHGLFAPKDTPDDRIIIMQNYMKEALQDPIVIEKFTKAGLTTDYAPAKEFQKTMQEIWDLLGNILKEHNLS